MTRQGRGRRAPLQKLASSEVIAQEDVGAAMAECGVHVDGLLASARTLRQNGDFNGGVIMAILAFEEMNKLLFYGHCKRKGVGVTVADMSNLSRHKYKLVWVTESVAQSMGEYSRIPGASLPCPEWYARDRLRDTGETLLRLDAVKQMAMYYDRRDGRTLTLRSVETRESVEMILIFLLGFVDHLADYEGLRQKFGDSDGLVRYSDEMLGSDLWARVSDYAGLCATPAYAGIVRQAMAAIDRIGKARPR